jgi:hypothetical protein
MFDHLCQWSLPDTSGKRTIFDMTINLDISCQVRHNIKEAIKFSMDTVLGDVGFD